MKKAIVFLTLILSFVIFPGEISYIEAATPTTPVRLRRGSPNTPNRPRVPSREYILFYYDEVAHECTIEFDETIDEVMVEIISLGGGTTATGIASADFPTFNCTLTPGDYHIVCTTPEGITFEGETTI